MHAWHRWRDEFKCLARRLPTPSSDFACSKEYLDTSAANDVHYCLAQEPSITKLMV